MQIFMDSIIKECSYVLSCLNFIDDLKIINISYFWYVYWHVLVPVGVRKIEVGCNWVVC